MKSQECDVGIKVFEKEWAHEREYDGEYVYGSYEVEGVEATCRGCGAQTESFGTGEGSVKRCMVLMKDECGCDGSFFFIPVCNF